MALPAVRRDPAKDLLVEARGASSGESAVPPTPVQNPLLGGAAPSSSWSIFFCCGKGILSSSCFGLQRPCCRTCDGAQAWCPPSSLNCLERVLVSPQALGVDLWERSTHRRSWASARCQGPARPRGGPFWLCGDPRGRICTGPGGQSCKRPLCWLTRSGPCQKGFP